MCIVGMRSPAHAEMEQTHIGHGCTWRRWSSKEAARDLPSFCAASLCFCSAANCTQQPLIIVALEAVPSKLAELPYLA